MENAIELVVRLVRGLSLPLTSAVLLPEGACILTSTPLLTARSWTTLEFLLDPDKFLILKCLCLTAGVTEGKQVYERIVQQ